MTEEPREPISEISEMNDFASAPAGHHFLAALGWGTLAGTLTLVVAMGAVYQDDALGIVSAGLVFIALFVSLTTLAGMVAIGLPVTVLLKAADTEYDLLYAAIGGLAGAAALAGFLGLPDNDDYGLLVLLASGALAGFSAALRWGRWREARADHRRRMATQRATGKRDNPVHDLLF